VGSYGRVQRLSIEFLDQRQSGRSFRLALNRDRHDHYLDRIREGGGSKAIVKLLLSLSSKGDLVIDAGANVGTVAAPLAVQDRRVLAIEAMAENYVMLLETASANGLDGLVPVHAAVTSSPGLLEITGSSAFARVVVDDAPGSTPGVTLDALTKAHGFRGATVLKLDVEGSEIDAIAGASELLSSRKLRHVVYEANGAHCERVGYRPRAIADALAEHGFEVFSLHGKTMIPAVDMDFQAIGNTDCIAARPGARGPSGYSIGQVGHAALVSGVVEALGARNHGYRRFMVKELACAPDSIRSDAEVRGALERLRDDDAVAVATRDAAAALLD
jgi:FkbM family methyltransferase